MKMKLSAILFFSFFVYATTATEKPAIQSIEPNAKTGFAKAVVVDHAPLIFTRQFLPINEKGEIVGKGDVQKQIETTFANLMNLSLIGTDGERIAKINVY